MNRLKGIVGMNEKNLLNGVEDTLYIPLAARIYASEKFPEFFYDEKALSLKQYIPTDSIENNTTEYFYMASVCRQQTIDRKIRGFLKENNRSNVVFLGAGLETAYNRIGNAESDFFQVDLPNVMDIRKKVLGNEDNEKLISGDMFTLDWIKDTSQPTMIVVSGVYQYFAESKIIDMIKKMKSRIAKGEVIFDATNSKGLELANKYVRKTGMLGSTFTLLTRLSFLTDDLTRFPSLSFFILYVIEYFIFPARFISFSFIKNTASS